MDECQLVSLGKALERGQPMTTFILSFHDCCQSIKQFNAVNGSFFGYSHPAPIGPIGPINFSVFIMVITAPTGRDFIGLGTRETTLSITTWRVIQSFNMSRLQEKYISWTKGSFFYVFMWGDFLETARLPIFIHHYRLVKCYDMLESYIIRSL